MYDCIKSACLKEDLAWVPVVWITCPFTMYSAKFVLGTGLGSRGINRASSTRPTARKRRTENNSFPYINVFQLTHHLNIFTLRSKNAPRYGNTFNCFNRRKMISMCRPARKANSNAVINQTIRH